MNRFWKKVWKYSLVKKTSKIIILDKFTNIHKSKLKYILKPFFREMKSILSKMILLFLDHCASSYKTTCYNHAKVGVPPFKPTGKKLEQGESSKWPAWALIKAYNLKVRQSEKYIVLSLWWYGLCRIKWRGIKLESLFPKSDYTSRKNSYL